MTNNNPSSDPNNLICEAVGCDAIATTKVAARLGHEESIILFLCENCKPKFTGGRRDK
ncbi:MAG: hypothetical protein M3044_03120 [Thermoproteota archaeon]|nr:hypothetical protein [Thermoproteota archaeon]